MTNARPERESQGGAPGALLQALRAHDAGQLGEAEAGCRGVLAWAPECAEARHLPGVVLARLGRCGEAVDGLERAAAIEPGNARFLASLGSALAEAGRLDEALTRFEGAISLEPTSIVALLNRGRALQALGRPEAAVESYRQALATDPAHVPALAALCRPLRSRDRCADVAAACTAALAAKPDLAEAHAELGLVALQADEPDRALEHFERAAATAPDMVTALQGRSAALARLGRPAEARAAALQACRRRPVRTRPRSGTPVATALVLCCAEQHDCAWHDGGLALAGPIKSTNMVEMLDRRRIALHDVIVNALAPASRPSGLPPSDVVFNAICDPDVSGRSLQRAQALLDGTAVPVINRPEAVVAASRDGNARRLRSIPGLVFPATVKARLGPDPAAEAAALMDAGTLRFPILLRRIGTHAGRSVVKADSPDELRSLAPSFAGQSCYLIQYIETAAGSPYHRRARTFWVDGASHPMAWTFNDRWNVRAAGRARPMSRHQWMVDEERAFLDDPSTILGARGLRALDRLGRALGLELFGIDAAPLPSGDVVVFEANPAMDSRAHFFEGFEYLWTYFDRLVGAVNALVAKRASRR